MVGGVYVCRYTPGIQVYTVYITPLLEQLRTFREACGERADGLCRYCGLLAERRCDALGCGVCVHQECMLEHTCWVRDASLCTLL